MSSSRDDSDLGPLIADLVGTLQQLESEFEPRTERGNPRPPSPRELVRFTSDIGIPAAILLLRTNIEALKLLQRTLRMADGRPPTTTSSSPDVRGRAQQLSRVTLSRLDGALADLQDAVEGRPEDEDARELLEEARELRTDLESKLETRTNGDDSAVDTDETSSEDASDETSVPVDVDAELRSIKNDFDQDEQTANDNNVEGDATDDGEDAGDGGVDAGDDGNAPAVGDTADGDTTDGDADSGGD